MKNIFARSFFVKSVQLNFTVCLFLVVASSLSFASDIGIDIKVDAAKHVGLFSLGIGSAVTLDATDAMISGPSLFLGNTVAPDGTNSLQIYFRKEDQQIYYIDATRFNPSDLNQQKILDPYEQVGGTCTGYAIYDFLQQSNLSGFTGTGALAAKLSTESGRTALLVDNINQYYLTPQHRYSVQGILNKYGKDLGFKCKTHKAQGYEKLKDKILKNLNSGLPVIISFYIGPKMYKSPFALQMPQANLKMDDRVWIPRKTGERNSGGHAIVAAGSFEFNAKTYLLTIDSDWSEPRVWDMDSFLNDRTVIDEVELTECTGL